MKSIKSNHILTSISKASIQAFHDIESDLCRYAENCAPSAEQPSSEFSHECVICAGGSGYLQDIDWTKVPRILGDTGFIAELKVMPGDYIFHSLALLHVHSELQVSEAQQRRLRDIFRLGLIRTQSQDPRFGLRQMSDIALRALSPGINDPTTAIEALNEMGSVLIHYAQKCQATGDFHYPGGSRLKLLMPTFEELLTESVDPVVKAGKDFRSVLFQAHKMLSHCRSVTDLEGRRQTLLGKIKNLESEM